MNSDDSSHGKAPGKYKCVFVQADNLIIAITGWDDGAISYCM